MGSSGPAGRVVVVSGPSGAGKSTVLAQVMKNCPLPLTFSVSATTRAPRPGEVDGVHYHFLAPEEFARRRAAGDFLECFEVFGRGNWYGTLNCEVGRALAAGQWVVLDVDVQGAAAVLKAYPDAITVFVDPGSVDELERRLRERGTETEQQIARRLETGRRDMQEMSWYRHRVVNRVADQAAAELCEILLRAAADGHTGEKRDA